MGWLGKWTYTERAAFKRADEQVAHVRLRNMGRRLYERDGWAIRDVELLKAKREERARKRATANGKAD